MRNAVEPDGYIKKLKPRHTPTDPNHLRRLEKSMRKDGWTQRPLVVVKIRRGRGYEYRGLTGSHRATAAMGVGILIPAVFVSRMDFTPKQWKFVTRSEEHTSELQSLRHLV